MNERKKPGFWQHADAETRVFTTILTWKFPKPYVFAFILGVSRPPRPHAWPPQRQLRAEFFGVQLLVYVDSQVIGQSVHLLS
jgi:hypothetical protein